MATWPATPVMRNDSARTKVPAILTDRDDAGGSSTRLMHTGDAWQFRTRYKYITAAQKDTFESFYTTNAALTVTLGWQDGNNYTVQFTGAGVEFNQIRGDLWGGHADFVTVAAA